MSQYIVMLGDVVIQLSNDFSYWPRLSFQFRVGWLGIQLRSRASDAISAAMCPIAINDLIPTSVLASDIECGQEKLECPAWLSISVSSVGPLACNVRLLARISFLGVAPHV